MDAELRSVADALAEVADAELRAFGAAANELMLMAAGLLSWMEHLADWELGRRAGVDFPLRPPDAAIPLEEHVESVIAARMLRDRFADDRRQESGPIVALFDAMVSVLGDCEGAQMTLAGGGVRQ